MHYQLNNVPERVERALRAKAEAEGTSLDQAILNAVERGLGLPPQATHDENLEWFFGGKSIDDASLKAIAEADVVHPDEL